MLSRKQFRKLKKIALFGGTRALDYNRNHEIYEYLLQQGYVRKADVRGYRGYIVSQAGYAAIHAHSTENFRFWFPSVISILALAVSFLAVLTE